MLEPYKYLIQSVAIERDSTGRVVAERAAQVVVVFGAAEAVGVITQFELQIEQLNREGTDESQQDNGRAEADAAERTPAGGLRQS